MNLTRGLKVHLRVFDIHGTILRVVTLRPQTTARFSTNYYHDTWHILAGRHGAMILGRLMYGLAFQRQPGTLVLLAGEHLVPTPFEADPPDPVLLVPAGLTTIAIDLLRTLKQRLRRSPGAPTTIRWHTFGMPADLEAERYSAGHHREVDALERRERMTRRAGFICYTAPPAILRVTGLAIYGMHDRNGSYCPMASHHGYGYWDMEGELQLIPELDDDVSAALVARREILGARRDIADWDERCTIWSRKDRALHRLRRARAAPAK
jgi:hypothetical protein